MTIAVYGFADKTGQRKTADAYATFSSAVTQGAESWLIDALRLASNGTWFQVLERASLDDIIKERQLISQTRETFLGKDAEKLTPMLFAGIIAQGGIIGYDTNIRSGGNKPIVSATPQVAAAPTKATSQQQIAQQVSQPPAAQQPVVMPINLGGGGQQQTGGGGSSGGGGGGSQGSGPSVPFLPAGNPDNFLVLYSRMVYNIVDG